jgi:hypothetical protein
MVSPMANGRPYDGQTWAEDEAREGDAVAEVAACP